MGKFAISGAHGMGKTTLMGGLADVGLDGAALPEIPRLVCDAAWLSDLPALRQRHVREAATARSSAGRRGGAGSGIDRDNMGRPVRRTSLGVCRVLVSGGLLFSARGSMVKPGVRLDEDVSAGVPAEAGVRACRRRRPRGRCGLSAGNRRGHPVKPDGCRGRVHRDRWVSEGPVRALARRTREG